MPHHRTRTLLLSALVGCLFFLDQLLKYLARSAPETVLPLLPPWIGWEYFPNPGIAFGLPLPSWMTVVATPIILFFLWEWYRKRPTQSKEVLGAIVICAGALSNFIDRLLFGVTIDYLRFFTAVINLADLMIIAGVLLLLFQRNTTEKHIPK